jgi:hypothetical protein
MENICQDLFMNRCSLLIKLRPMFAHKQTEKYFKKMYTKNIIMKTTNKKYIYLFPILLFSFALFSCKKDEGKLPNISFKGGSGYTSASTTATKNQTVLIGINASKAEGKDVLKTFNASSSFDGGAATTIVQESLSGSQGDNYSKDLSVTTRNQSGTETYTFTVTNRDGISNQVSLTLTVN